LTTSGWSPLSLGPAVRNKSKTLNDRVIVTNALNIGQVVFDPISAKSPTREARQHYDPLIKSNQPATRLYFVFFG
jgi:hypothetical protein